MSESEITKVQLVIRKFLFETREVVKDPQASMEWLSRFRDTLMYQDCENEPCGYALTLLIEARKFNESQREKIQIRHARKALLEEGIENPSREQIDRKRAEMYSDEETTEGAANGNNADASTTAPTVDYPATPDDGKFHYQEPIEISTNCGADAVNRKTTVDRKSATSAPLRPWKEVVEQSLGISETDQSGAGKGVRPPNPVPGLLRKRRAAGSPLKPGTGPSPAARSLPKSMAEVSDFACSENLDYDDARLWWEQNFVERNGKDKDGNRITNWHGALINFCKSQENKRNG